MSSWFFFIALLIITIIFLLLPIIYLFYSSTLGQFSNLSLSFSSLVLESIALTIITSFLSSLVSILLALPSAYFLSRVNFFGKKIIEGALDLPSSIPHPIIGIAILLIFSEVGPLGSISNLLGFQVLYSIQGIIIAQTLISMPISIRALINTFKSMDLSPEISALTLGVPISKIFLRVVLPRIRNNIFSSFLITFARATSEFGSIAIVAYYVSQPPFNGINPAPVLIWNLFEIYGLKYSLPASFSLLLISFAISSLIKIIEGKD
jgi:ABC-type sulfate transport system permease component